MTAPIVHIGSNIERTPFPLDFDADYQTGFWQGYSDNDWATLWQRVAEGKRRD